MPLSPETYLVGIVGATATGKTAVGIELAGLMKGEIVSADAVAVYRGLNIGAAKPTMEEQALASFHLIDVANPDADFTVADFTQQSEAAFEQIRARSHMPLLVGGTGLYVRSVTATLSIPAVPPQIALRERLWQEVEEFGAPYLHGQLEAVDAASASKILRGDAKRIIRALEVYTVTGRPLSSFHTPEGVQGIGRTGVRLFGLMMEREALYQRIEERVETMLRSGFVDEVRGLLNRGYSETLKSMQSLGYRHISAYLHDEIEYDVMVETLKRDTRRFARRQLMWFRADSRIEWIAVDGESALSIARQIFSRLSANEVELVLG